MPIYVILEYLLSANVSLIGTKYIVGASASTPGNLIVGANDKSLYAIVTVTDAACISVNFALSNNFLVTLGGNRTLKAPTNCTVGQRRKYILYTRWY